MTGKLLGIKSDIFLGDLSMYLSICSHHKAVWKCSTIKQGCFIFLEILLENITF